MRSGPSSTGKVKAKGPRVARVRYAVSVEHLTCLENAQCGARNVTSVAIKTISVHSVGLSSQELRNRKSHSTSRGCKGKGKPHHSRSRSKSVTKSAHSIVSLLSDDLHAENTDLHGESADPHGEQRENLHGANSFQDHQESTDFLKKSFSTISRSKSVASISNDMDPDGKTKILTVLQIKLPHHNSIDDITVKVDDGAEGNILPLNSFRAMFPHALDVNGYPKPGFLRGSRTTLECYDDGKLINHGSIKLRLQHYLDKSFQDHSFYVVETKTPKPIIVGHPASIRLGLI